MACTLYWTVPQLYRLTNYPPPHTPPTTPGFCMDMIGIHFMCCFFSTHKSQASKNLPSPGFYYMCVSGGLQWCCTAAVPRSSSSFLGGVSCWMLVPAVSVSAPSCVCQNSLSCLLVVSWLCCLCVCVCVFNKNCYLSPQPLSHVSSTREQIKECASEIPDRPPNSSHLHKCYLNYMVPGNQWWKKERYDGKKQIPTQFMM